MTLSFPTIDANLISTALVLLDDQFAISSINPAAEQLLGITNRQMQNTIYFFDWVKGEITPDLLKSLQTPAQSAFIEEIELHLPKGILRSNVMITPCQWLTEKDLLLEFQSSAHIKKIRKDLQIQQQSRVSEHLIQNLAHEIKNPLGGIKGAAQLLERKLPPNFSNKYSRIIVQEADRLGALVDRLLMPAKPEVAEMVNPHRVIEQALEIVLLQIPNKIKVIKDYDPSLPDICIAPNQIQQALLNLIKNAAEAVSSQKSDQTQLTLSTRMLHQHTIGQQQFRQVLKIVVEDNGAGIAKNFAHDIFFPTISGKSSSGLGLSIAQSLVQRHQGIIELESRQNPTRFGLYLPMIKASKTSSNEPKL